MIIFISILLILGLVLEWYSVRDGLRHIHFDCVPMKNKVEPGETFEVVTRISNIGWLPVSYIRTETAYPVSAQLPDTANVREEHVRQWVLEIFRLWGRQTIERSTKAKIEKRGVHSFSSARLCRGDFLGLQEVEGELGLQSEVVVYPRECKEEKLVQTLSHYCGDILAQRWLLHDPILTVGVREYTGYEPMHTISWAQSARHGTWMVREFDYTKELSCTIVLAVNGLNISEPEQLDRCCSLARTACQMLVGKGMSVSLYTNGYLLGYTFGSVWSCEAGMSGMEDVLDTLARLYGPAQCAVHELFDSCSRQGQEHAYIIIAPCATPEMQAAVEELQKRSRIEVMLLTADAWEEA